MHAEALRNFIHNRGFSMGKMLATYSVFFLYLLGIKLQTMQALKRNVLHYEHFKTILRLGSHY